MFHKRKKIDLEAQILQDRKKQEICKRQGIDLISISFDCDLFSYIEYILVKKDYLLQNNSSSSLPNRDNLLE